MSFTEKYLKKEYEKPEEVVYDESFFGDVVSFFGSKIPSEQLEKIIDKIVSNHSFMDKIIDSIFSSPSLLGKVMDEMEKKILSK